MSVTAVGYDPPVGRWEPDSRSRLADAALDLYGERGFEGTTVAEIAARAGVTERTFFRHFADKREVLFGEAGAFEALVLDPVAAAPAGTPPIEAAAAGLAAAATFLEGRRAFARRRQAVIDANLELQERELAKLAALARGLAGALRARGEPDPDATLTAEVAVAVFRATFERWAGSADTPPLPDLIREALGGLGALVAPAVSPRRPPR